MPPPPTPSPPPPSSLSHPPCSFSHDHPSNSDALATHALGDDSLIKLGRDDLAEILGDKEIANEVLDLYHMLEISRKEFEGNCEGNFEGDCEGGEDNIFQGSMHADNQGFEMSPNMEMSDFLNNLTKNAVNSQNNVRERGLSLSTVLPMMSEMAMAINALSEQVNTIAQVVIQQPSKVAAPVKIQVKKIEEKMLELHKMNTSALAMDRQMLMQMNALLNPSGGGVRRLRSGGLRGNQKRDVKSQNHKQLLGLHSLPDAL